MKEVYGVLTIPKDITFGSDSYPKNKVLKKGKYIVNQFEYGNSINAADVLNLTNKDTHEQISFLLYNIEKYCKDWVVTTEYS